MGQRQGDDPPATTHLASGLPASLNSHWLAGFLGRVAVGHRSGPLLNEATAQWPSLPPLLPSRFGWAGLWWVGLHRLSLSLSLLLALLIPDRITGTLYLVRFGLLLWVSDLSGQWVGCGLQYSTPPVGPTIDGLIWVAGVVTRPLWKGASVQVGFVKVRRWAPVHVCISLPCLATRGTGDGAYLLAYLSWRGGHLGRGDQRPCKFVYGGRRA